MGVRRLRISALIDRLRHFRGHGVHSPYVYAIVRNVYMRSTLIDEAMEPIQELGLKSRRVIELQNLAHHCHQLPITIDSTDGAFIIMQAECETTILEQAIAHGRTSGATIAIITRGNHRHEMMEQIIEAHPSTSIRRPDYLLLLNNHLPKQHFRL